MPLGVVAIDGSTLSLERSTNGEMIARSPHHENPLLKRPMGETMLIGWVLYFGV